MVSKGKRRGKTARPTSAELDLYERAGVTVTKGDRLDFSRARPTARLFFQLLGAVRGYYGEARERAFWAALRRAGIAARKSCKGEPTRPVIALWLSLEAWRDAERREKRWPGGRARRAA